MTRRRRALVGALLALTAIGVAAGAVTSAGAHTPATFKFENGMANNSRVVGKKDGTGVGAIHKIYIPSIGNITCFEPEFEGTAPKLLNFEFTMTKFMYSSCKLESNNEVVFFNQNNCEVTLVANDEFEIAPAPEKVCAEEEEPMEFVFEKTGCIVEIPAQTIAGGLGYTNVTNGGVQEVTMSMTLTGTKGFRGEKCATEGAFVGGEYKAGNTLLGGFEDVDKGKAVPMKWLATVP